MALRRSVPLLALLLLAGIHAEQLHADTKTTTIVRSVNLGANLPVPESSAAFQRCSRGPCRLLRTVWWKFSRSAGEPGYQVRRGELTGGIGEPVYGAAAPSTIAPISVTSGSTVIVRGDPLATNPPAVVPGAASQAADDKLTGVRVALRESRAGGGLQGVGGMGKKMRLAGNGFVMQAVSLVVLTGAQDAAGDVSWLRVGAALYIRDLGGGHLGVHGGRVELDGVDPRCERGPDAPHDAHADYQRDAAAGSDADSSADRNHGHSHSDPDRHDRYGATPAHRVVATTRRDAPSADIEHATSSGAAA